MATQRFHLKSTTHSLRKLLLCSLKTCSAIFCMFTLDTYNFDKKQERWLAVDPSINIVRYNPLCMSYLVKACIVLQR